MCCAEAVVGMVCADSCRVAVSCDRPVRYGSRFFSFRLPLLSYVIRNLMSVMREQLLNSRTVRLEGLGTFTMIAKANGKGVELESKVSSAQITSLRCQFTPEYTREANGSATRALTSGVEFVHVKDVAGSFVAADDSGEDPDDGKKPDGGNGSGEAPDPSE